MIFRFPGEDDGWRPEERFRNWGKPLPKLDDEFDQWAAEIHKQAVEEQLEAELRQLFLEELRNGR